MTVISGYNFRLIALSPDVSAAVHYLPSIFPALSFCPHPTTEPSLFAWFDAVRGGITALSRVINAIPIAGRCERNVTMGATSAIPSQVRRNEPGKTAACVTDRAKIVGYRSTPFGIISTHECGAGNRNCRYRRGQIAR